MKTYWKKFVCLVLAHDLTCKAAEGVDPTEYQRRTREGFLLYARVWCRRCETTFEPSEFNLQVADAIFSNPKPTKRSHSDRWVK